MQYNEFKERYNVDITFIDYYNVTSRIPRRWLNVIEIHEQKDMPDGLWNTNSNIADLQLHTKVYSFVYLNLIKEYGETPNKAQYGGQMNCKRLVKI